MFDSLRIFVSQPVILKIDKAMQFYSTEKLCRKETLCFVYSFSPLF